MERELQIFCDKILRPLEKQLKEKREEYLRNEIPKSILEEYELLFYNKLIEFEEKIAKVEREKEGPQDEESTK